MSIDINEFNDRLLAMANNRAKHDKTDLLVLWTELNSALHVARYDSRTGTAKWANFEMVTNLFTYSGFMASQHFWQTTDGPVLNADNFVWLLQSSLLSQSSLAAHPIALCLYGLGQLASNGRLSNHLLPVHQLCLVELFNLMCICPDLNQNMIQMALEGIVRLARSHLLNVDVLQQPEPPTPTSSPDIMQTTSKQATAQQSAPGMHSIFGTHTKPATAKAALFEENTRHESASSSTMNL